MNETWAQVITIIAANLAAFFWARSEAGEDRRNQNLISIEARRETQAIIQSIQADMRQFQEQLIKIEASKQNR